MCGPASAYSEHQPPQPRNDFHCLSTPKYCAEFGLLGSPGFRSQFWLFTGRKTESNLWMIFAGTFISRLFGQSSAAMKWIHYIMFIQRISENLITLRGCSLNLLATLFNAYITVMMRRSSNIRGMAASRQSCSCSMHRVKIVNQQRTTVFC